MSIRLMNYMEEIKGEFSRVAKIFNIRQRINELRKANKNWPFSDNLDARNQEIHDLELHLKKLEDGE